MTELNNWGADLTSPLAGDFIIYDGTQYVRFNPVNHDFLPYHIETLNASTSGTGASGSAAPLTNYLEGKALGAGTTSSGYSVLTTSRIITPSSAKSTLVFTIRTDNNLSDATDEYEYWIGAYNTIGSVTAGWYFKYQRTTSTNWLCCTQHSSSETATDSGVAVTSSTNVNLRIEYDGATPAVKFYIDNVLVATNTTDLGTDSIFVRCGCIKTAGTTSRGINIYTCYQTIIR